MKSGITVIGMPSSGKSITGVPLAKRLGLSSVNMGITIREKEGRFLKGIIAQEGIDGFLRVEERTNAGLDMTLSIVAPDGSAIYGEKAMEHLKEISEAVYLKMSYGETENHIGNMVDRGVALRPGFAPRDLYNGRMPYYKKYADIAIDEEGKIPGETVDALRDIIGGMMDRSMIKCIVGEQEKTLEEENRKIEAYEAEIIALKEELAPFRVAETGGCGNQ